MLSSIDQTALWQTSTPPRQTRARHYLPLGVDLSGVACLIVGAGPVGARKAMTLLGAGARVTVLSPRISSAIREAVEQGRIEWCKASYEESGLEGFALVVAATSDRALNRRIGREAEARGILCCVASSGRAGRVVFPAVFSDQEITVAVHTHGRNCRLAQEVRNRIAQWREAEIRRDRTAGRSTAVPARSARVGKVYLVGAGPGAPDLITLRGLRVLESAQVILADRLLPRTFLSELGIDTADKLVQWLGDEKSHWSQQEINHAMVAHARAGRVVVRLKNGDPFVFGRGDAEVEYLAEHEIPWEVIPGASACTAALTAAGLPLTRRGRGRSFAVATARLAGGQTAQSFPRADSLVVLMGAGVLETVVARLLEDGWAAHTPAALVERATLPGERYLRGPLAQMPALARQAAVGSPALLVLGCAAAKIAGAGGDSRQSRKAAAAGAK